MLTRSELLKSPEYWITQLQISIYRQAEDFMSRNDMNRTQFAQHLGVTKGYVTQLLNGDYNYSISKLVELSLKMGVIPEIDFTPLEAKIQTDMLKAGTTLHSVDYYTSSSDTELLKTA